MIGKLNCKLNNFTSGLNGVKILSFEIDTFDIVTANKIAQKSIDEHLTIKISKYVKSRTLDQNKMMWALLEIMSKHLNGGRTGGIQAEDCYLNMLTDFGAKYEYIMILPEALPLIKEKYRALKIMEERDYKGKTMLVVKCFYGSSSMTTKEMGNLIDGILDRLAEYGVDELEYKYIKDQFI